MIYVPVPVCNEERVLRPLAEKIDRIVMARGLPCRTRCIDVITHRDDRSLGEAAGDLFEHDMGGLPRLSSAAASAASNTWEDGTR